METGSHSICCVCEDFGLSIAYLVVWLSTNINQGDELKRVELKPN
jgi:hypothetical protein